MTVEEIKPLRMKLSPAPFSGKQLRCFEQAGLALSETVYPSGLKMRCHAHGPAYFSLVLNGSYDERIGSKARVCKPLSLLFHPPGESHAVNFHDSLVRIFRFEVKSAWLECARQYGLSINEPVEFSGRANGWLAIRLYNEFRRMDEASPLAIEGLALEILAQASREKPNDLERHAPRFLERAKEIIHARFNEEMTLALLADAVAVHPVYLARQFRKHYHCTVGEYLRRIRIEQACAKILNSDLTLARIAASTGFCDQSHFANTFKRLTGMTPSEYRLSARSH